MVIDKNTENRIIYAAQELHTSLLSTLFNFNAISFHQHFHYILRLIYQLIFFCIYSLNNVNTLQRDIIYHIHIHNY